MTDKTRPEWMPSIKEVNSLAWRLTSAQDDDGDLAIVLYRTGLRAQIAVLEEMPVCVSERGGKAYLCEECDRRTRRKIAALREEIEG